MTYSEIQKLLLDYNSNPDTQSIRNYYSNKSFFEVISKTRDEGTHSAFLAWLLKGEEITSKQDKPLMLFLDLLINNSEGIDTPLQRDEVLKATILSRTLELNNIKTYTEKTVKDVSTIPSRDRLDIFLTASMNEPVNGKTKLRIVIENKVFSDENKAKMDELNKVTKDSDVDKSFNKAAYKKLSQTQRYYSAVMEHPKDEKYQDETFTIFVYLYPFLKHQNSPLDEHFIPVSYQDILDYVLEPLTGNSGMNKAAETYIREYIKALTVPSISDMDNEMTVLAVDKNEKEKLEKFWNDYKDIITESAESTKKKGTNAEDIVLQKFYEKNQSLFIAIYNLLPDKAKALKPFTTRDYTKYTLKFDGQIIGEHLGKRAVVLLAAKTRLDNKLNLPKGQDNSWVFCYNESDFEDKHQKGLISDDTYNNRYTIIETNAGEKFAICNQWGVGNWNWVEDELLGNPRFELISE